MSFRLRLFLMVFAVWLMAAASFGILARSIYLQERVAGQQHVREFGRTMNLIIERELDKRAAIGRTLGASASLRRRALDEFYTEAVAATQGSDSWALLVTAADQVMNTRLPFQERLRIPRPPGAPMVTSGPPDIFFAPEGSATKGPVIALFSPELGTSPPQYDVGIAFEPRVIQTLVGEQAAPEASLVSVIDDDQTIMARTREPQKWVGRKAGAEISRRAREGREGFLDSKTLDGVDSLTYVSAPNRYRWTVIVATPQSTLAATAKRLTAQAVAAAAVLLLLGLWLVLYVSRLVGDPVAKLRDAATVLQSNAVPPLLHTRVSEIDDISAVLHQAGLRSQEATRALEQRVADAVREAQDAQAKLLDGQKHEAIGRLTGGIAHDFNNLLQTIRTALQVCELSKDGPPPARVLDAAIRATNRAADLVRQMLAFGRARPHELSAVDLPDFLLGARELIQKAVGKSIALVADIEPDLPHLHVDPAQLELALLNLIFNARDAMPDGGRVTVLARREGTSQVLVTVLDDGKGMDESTLAKATEPYFTTKPVGAGSGLGLAQVRAFALQSGGDIRLSSAVGEGTRVEMFLPTTSAPVHSQTVESSPPAPRPLRLLMVEDDVLVQSVVMPALESAGHTVTHAATADAAVVLLQQGILVDVVFTDVVMPGRMTGMDLAAWCAEHRPGVPVLVATGYSAQATVAGAVVLNKPYDLATLLERLGQTAARFAAGTPHELKT